ncbi:ATP-binding protein [Lipingzhangella halophila]|nr:ATP-binding protein [Lipingzhangella halophila]
MSVQAIQRLRRHVSGDSHELAALRRWLRSELDYAPELIQVAAEQALAEAAGNAIKHTHSGEPGGSYEVIVTCYPAFLRGLVIDEGPKAPVPAPTPATADPMDEHGRGFCIIDAFCEHWEFIPRPSGSLTWFELVWEKSAPRPAKPLSLTG